MIGGSTTLAVIRGGKVVQIPVKLTAAPELPTRDLVKIKGPSPFAGASFVNISPAVLEEMSLAGLTSGVVATEVEDGSVAQEVGVQKGDVIISINGTKITNTGDMSSATATKHAYWKLTVNRGGQVVNTVIGG